MGIIRGEKGSIIVRIMKKMAWPVIFFLLLFRVLPCWAVISIYGLKVETRIKKKTIVLFGVGCLISGYILARDKWLLSFVNGETEPANGTSEQMKLGMKNGREIGRKKLKKKSPFIFLRINLIYGENNKNKQIPWH